MYSCAPVFTQAALGSGRYMVAHSRLEGGHVRELKEALARAALVDEAAAHR